MVCQVVLYLQVNAVSGLVLPTLFFNATPTTEIFTYGHTLSLHDALPIGGRSRSPCTTCTCVRSPTTVTPTQRSGLSSCATPGTRERRSGSARPPGSSRADRKSTRLNSSH